MSTLRKGEKEQGASTITMQLARSFWLDQDKTFRRKIAEVFLTIELERRFTKKQIIEFYANEIISGGAAASVFTGSARRHEPISPRTFAR